MSTKKRDHDHGKHASPTEKKGGPVETPTPVIRKVSDDERTRSIQIRAYDLWEHAGKPKGDAARVQFWCEAEQEIATAYASR